MKDEVVTAIYETLEEIISVLCYQPVIPLQHKTDMLNKLHKLSEVYYGNLDSLKEQKS